MKEWEGEVCEVEGDAFSAGRDDIDTVTAIVGEGRAKVVSAVPVRVPRETVVGVVKLKLAGRVKGVGGEVKEGEMVEARPGRE